MFVEHGDRTRDTTVDDLVGDTECTEQRSPDRRRSCSTPSQRVRQLTTASAAMTTMRVRSVVTRPASTQPFGGIGRGAGVLQPGRQFVGTNAAVGESSSSTIFHMAYIYIYLHLISIAIFLSNCLNYPDLSEVTLYPDH